MSLQISQFKVSIKSPYLFEELLLLYFPDLGKDLGPRSSQILVNIDFDLLIFVIII